jgi:hypothetical protein
MLSQPFTRTPQQRQRRRTASLISPDSALSVPITSAAYTFVMVMNTAFVTCDLYLENTVSCGTAHTREQHITAAAAAAVAAAEAAAAAAAAAAATTSV